MIEVSEALKTAYKRDSVHKSFVIRFLDGSLPDITNGNIIAESMVLDEILCDEEQIKFGLCNASTFSIQVANINVNIKGKDIAPVLIVNGEELPLGIFTIQKVEKMQGKAYKTIYAIDYMDKVNSDVTEWYNKLEFPITVKALRDGLFSHLGLQQMEVTLPIDALSVGKIEQEKILGTDIMRPICELIGAFGHFGRSGKFEYVKLNNSGTGFEIISDNYNLLKSFPVYEDYTTCAIDGVEIIDVDGTVYVTGEYDNAYKVEHNYILNYQNAETVVSVINSLFNAISGVYYRPISVLDTKGQPYLELGDKITFANKQDTVNSFILTRHLTGIQSLTDSITAQGTEYLTYDDNGIFKKLNDVNNKADAIGKDLEITKVTFAKTIDGFVTEVSKEITETNKNLDNLEQDLADNYSTTTEMNSLIEQTTEGINTEVLKRITETKEYADKVANTAEINAKNDTAEKLKKYSTTTEVESKISQSAEELSLSVSKAYATKSETVASNKIYYALSTSSTEPPTSGWNTTAPEWQDGKYMWQKTVEIKADGTEESTMTCIQGAKGKDGESGTSSYTHIRYSSNSDGSNFVATPTTATKYIGIYVGTSSTAPTSTSSYSWSKYVGEQGAAGNDGKGIKTTSITYQASSSGTTVPTGTWTTSIPTVSAGQYLWTRTIVTYTDSTTSTSYSVGRNGTNGSNGKDGSNGVGISSISNKYAVSASNSTAPTTWHDSVQTMSATNKYLWNYEIITYSNGSTSETNKRVIGVYGDKGDSGANGKDGTNGKGISSITEYFLATSSNSGVTTSTSGWTTTIQNTTITNKYLWNYEVIKYTDNSTYTSIPVIIGTHGATGATGATGKGIKSIVTQYYLSTSNTAQTGGSWTTTPPTWVPGKYIWTRDYITWSDNTTSSTTAVLDNSLNDLGNRVTSAESSIKTNAQEINLRVKEENYTGEVIASLINQTAEAIKIIAKHIDLNGIVTANENFKILKDGSMEAKNGSFNGEIRASSGTIDGSVAIKDKLRMYLPNVDKYFDAIATAYGWLTGELYGGELALLNPYGGGSSITLRGGSQEYEGTPSENDILFSGNAIFENSVHSQRNISADGQVLAGSKVYMWSDSEGGNIELISPGGVNWQMNAYNGNFRLYKGGGEVGFTWDTNGYFIANQIYASSGWLRSSGNTGWYNESYGGGWYMSDAYWIRVYNNKRVYMPDGIALDGNYWLKTIRFGTTALTSFSPSGTSSVLIDSATCSAWGINGANSALFVSNGDAGANATHVHSASFGSGGWYAVYDRAVTSAIRVNWMLITW